MKILIVDDTFECRDVLCDVFEGHGQEVIEAQDGQEGYEKALLYTPDLIITDILMPRVDGFTLIRNIKNDPRLAAIPCVVYSAIYTGSKDKELALAAGAEAFIAKPKTPEEICEEIQIILDRITIIGQKPDKRLIVEENMFLKKHRDIVASKLEEKVKELEQDIVRRKQVEEKLTESEKSLANAQRIAHLGNWEWDIVNNRLRWSDEIYRIFGFIPQSFDATYESFLNFVHPADREFVKDSVNKALYEKQPYSIDHRIVLPDGTERIVHEQSEVISDSMGKAIQMHGTVQDITERKKREEEVYLLQTITMAITEAEDFLVALNMVLRKVCESTGWVYGEAWLPSADDNCFKFAQAWYNCHENLAEFVKQSEKFTFPPGVGLPGRVWSSKKPEWKYDVTVDGNFPRAKIATEFGLKAAMGIPVIAGNEVVAVLIFFVRKRRTEDEQLVRLITTVAMQLGVVIKQKRAEDELRKLSTVINQSINAIFITNVEGTIEYVNPMFEQVTGYPKEEVLGQNPRILASGETTHAEYGELWRTITAGKTWRGVFKNKKKNGQYYWGCGVISPIINKKGIVTHFLAVQEDITEKMKSEEKIRYLSSYDETTGLFNRTCFMGLLQEWITRAQANNQSGVILLLNIDSFRLINDVYGQSVGDNLLHRVAMLLQNTLADIDPLYLKKATRESVIGRMGGDEFSILLPSRGEKEGLDIAEYIRKRIEEFRFADITGSLTASIGVVLYPGHGVTIHDLFTKADAAVYHAKELGQNRVHLYHPEDLVLEKMHSRVTWKERIQKAIEEDRFELWFQPILDLKDNAIHHYEALARMRGPDGKIILPELFISIAERFGFISAIDYTIIEKAMRFQSKLNQTGRELSFSINLSGKELGDTKLLEFLKSKLTETGVNPEQLIFEITETAAIHDIDRAIKFVETLKALGCGFSLDDFGVGFTSFQYLKELKVDYIKIDGSFIRKLHASKIDCLFVKAIVDVAKGMGIKTIAEFVENEETIPILKEYGVDYAQGYFIGKPSPNI